MMMIAYNNKVLNFIKFLHDPTNQETSFPTNQKYDPQNLKIF